MRVPLRLWGKPTQTLIASEDSWLRINVDDQRRTHDVHLSARRLNPLVLVHGVGVGHGACIFCSASHQGRLPPEAAHRLR